MMDFLSFKTFISTEVLIVFYYLGALIFPAGIWFLSKWLIHKYHFVDLAHTKGKELLWNSLNKTQKNTIVVTFGLSSLLVEIFWCMLFEFLITYMQMQDVHILSELFVAQ